MLQLLLQAAANAQQTAQQASPSMWYETPTGAAAIVALVGVLCAPFINSWLQNRKSKVDKTLHLSDTTLTLNSQERKELMEQMRKNHDQEVKFLKNQLEDLGRRSGMATINMKLHEYEARQKSHAYGNECTRLQSQIYMLQLELTKHGLPVPDFRFKDYAEMMAGVDEKVLNYKEELEEELERELRIQREEVNDAGLKTD